MVNVRRKMWAIPDRLFDNLADKPFEVQAEVLAKVRAYNHWWDDNHREDGFDFTMSAAAMAEFFRVYDDLLEANTKYFAKCETLSQNAAAGVKKKQEKSVRRKKSKEYYDNHREAINSKRRGKYSSVKKSQTKKKNCQTKTTDESTQSQAEQAIAENSANAHKIIGLNNNPSLRSELLLEREFEGKPSYPQEPVEKSEEPPTGSLSGSKAEQTAGLTVVCSKAVSPAGGGSEVFGSKESGSEDDGREAVGQSRSEAVSAAKRCLSASSARNVCAGGGAAKRDETCLLSAPHEPGDGEVLIKKNFQIDFEDRIFAPYKRADVFLRRGVAEWLVKNKLGCSVEKKWICRQIVKFAQNQGKIQVLMGVENDD